MCSTAAAGWIVDMTTTEFPGRWVEGVSFVLSPLLLLAGVLLRVGYDGFFPSQLAAFAESPTLMTASYSAWTAGIVLAFPAVIGLSRRIWVTQPRWAVWGGMAVLLGLLARSFHAGVSHLAFQLVDVQGLTTAQQAVGDTYGAFHIFHPVNVATFLGWIVLAFGAWRSGTLGIVQSVGLGLMSALPLGVLKGTGPMSIVAAVGLCVAFLPYGIKVLKDGRAPKWWAIPLTVVIAAGLVVLGETG